MNKAEQFTLANQVLQGLKDDIIKKIPQMPEDWNGFEIKHFILDYYIANYFDPTMLTGTRKKQYKDFCYQNSFI